MSCSIMIGGRGRVRILSFGRMRCNIADDEGVGSIVLMYKSRSKSEVESWGEKTKNLGLLVRDATRSGTGVVSGLFVLLACAR